MNKNILLGFILLLWQIDCTAQKNSSANVANFSLAHYTDDNGLPQNSVKSIAADEQGFIWLATEGGLVRFDGQRFYTFTKQNLAIPTSRIYGFQPSLTRQTDRSKNSPAFYGIINETYALKVQKSMPSSDSVYMAKLTQLPFWNTGKRDSYLSTGLPTNSYSQHLAHFIILTSTGDGCFYVCHRQTVAYYDHWKKIYQIPCETDGRWTFFTIGQTLYHHHENGTLSRIDRSGTSALTLTGDISRQDAFDPKTIEVYWNNVSNQTFFHINKKLFEVRQQAPGKLDTRLLLEGFDVKNKDVKTIHYDAASQRIMLGTGTEGLFVFTPKPFQTLITPGDQNENVLYGQTPFGADRVLTPTGLVLGVDRLNGKQIYKRLAAVEAQNNTHDKFSLLIDQQGYIWLKQDHYLIQYDPKGERLLRSWDLVDEIRTIYQRPGGGPIWIGTKHKGVYRINPSDSTPAPEVVSKDSPELIYYLQQETPDALLVGTEHGLYRFNPQTRQIQLIKGTRKLFIRSIYVPQPGEIWFTTYGDGFFLCQSGKLTRFPLDDNQYLATSHYIVDDKRGYFWIPTNKGLFQMAHQDLMNYAKANQGERPFYHYYAKDQGFLTNEFNGGGQPGPVRLANGYVSLPSLRGLVWFIPERLDLPLPNKPILLDWIRVNNVSLPVPGDSIQLSLEPKQLKIHVTTPYFGNPYNLHFAYALAEGHASLKSAEWITVNSQDPTILFSTLPSGTHTLLIRKTNGFGTGNYRYKKIVLVVPLLWYEIGWVRVIMIGLALLAIYIFARLRFRHIVRKNQNLEALITSRTEDLHLTLSQLKESEQELNQQLHLQSRLMASISHDVQSPLLFVMNTTQRMRQLVTARNYDALDGLLGTISFTIGNVSILLKDLLTYTKMKVYERRNYIEPINLHSLVAAKSEVFASILTLNQNRFVNDIPVDLTVHSDPHLLGIILHNLVDNASKYTENGLIRIYTAQLGVEQHVIITNTGTGMDQQTVDWFNGVPEDVGPGESAGVAHKSGTGLLIVKELSAYIHIRLFVEQTESTAVHLIF